MKLVPNIVVIAVVQTGMCELSQESSTPGLQTSTVTWPVGNWAAQVASKYMKLHLHMDGFKLHAQKHSLPSCHCCCCHNHSMEPKRLGTAELSSLITLSHQIILPCMFISFFNDSYNYRASFHISTVNYGATPKKLEFFVDNCDYLKYCGFFFPGV